MNTNFADKIFRMLFIFVFIVGMAGMPNTRVIAQSPLPESTLEKSASPTTYNQVGDVINYSYVLTNTGSGTLSGPFTVTDDKTTITCPENITPVELSHTMLFDHFENGNLAQYVSGTPDYVNGQNGFGQAADFSSGAWLRYDMPGWYQWSTYYDPAGKAGSVDLWVYPQKYNIELVDFNWNYSNTPPSSGGYILHFGINPDGKLTGAAWSSIYGPENNPTQPVIQLPAGNTTIPLNQWAHVAYTWGANGTRLYVNGVQDAFSPDNLYPALNSANYVYVPYWGFPGIGYIDDLRITSSSQTNFGISALAQGESFTCTGSYTITQNDVDNQSLTNTAQAHAYFGAAPLDSNQDTATVIIQNLQPNPIIAAFLFSNSVAGFHWTQGTPVTLTIDNPDNGPGIDYTETQTSVVAVDDPWDPTQTKAHFQLSGFTLQPGQILTMTDGTTTKIHTVTSLTLGGGRADNNTVWGTAKPGSVVEVTKQMDHNIFRRVVANGQGNWLADFSVAGDEPSEENPYDIQYGDVMMVIQNDDDYDHTQFDWSANNPAIVVWPEDDRLYGDDWNWDRSVDITIDDPSNGQGVDYSLSIMPGVRPWNTNGSWLEIKLNDFDLKPGQIVKYTNGYFTKTHTIKSVSVKNINLDNDTISGTAEPGTALNTWVQNVEGPIQRDAVADVDGNWIFNFSIRQNQWDTLYDIVSGSNGFGKNFDDDGDATNFSWKAFKPIIFVDPNEDSVYAWDWPIGTLLTLEIDNPATSWTPDYTTTQVSAGFNDWEHGFELGGIFDIQPSYVVTVSAEGITKQHIVTHLTVTNIDIDADTVSGTAYPGSSIHVGTECDETGCANRNMIVDATGTWTVDFSNPVSDPSQGMGTIDLRPGSDSHVYEHDEDGDSTKVRWSVPNVPNPRFDAWYKDGYISAYDWPLGTLLTLEVEDSNTPQSPEYSTTTVVGSTSWDPNQTQAEFHLNGAFVIEPGMTLTVSGAAMTKTLVVANLTISSIDQDTDTISGGSEPNQPMWMYYDNSSGGCCRNFQSDENGLWSVNSSQPGPNGEPVQDIRPGSGGTINARDEDGDNTSLSWGVPNPTFGVRVNDNVVEGWEWTLNSTVTIDINNGEYTDTAVVRVAPWDPNQTWFQLNIENYDLKTGDIVRVAYGNLIKQLTVTGFMITNVDIVTDKVYGVANPGQRVNIWTCWQNDPCGSREVAADQDGNWETNFAVPGEQSWEQQTADLRPGSWIDSSVSDEDGDSTMFGMNIKNPFLIAFPENEAVEGWEWPDGTTVYLTIDDPATPQAVDFARAGVMAVTTWGDPRTYLRFDFAEEYDLKVGDVVTITDEVMPRAHVVLNLSLTTINPMTDTITGQADPGANVILWPHEFDQVATVYTTAGPDGAWTADFTGLFDLAAGTGGRSEILDDEGNATAVDWNIPFNLPPVADAGADRIAFAGETITLDASASSDPEAGALTYAWDLDNDGLYDDASGVTATISFNQAGDHLIGLRVTDVGGLSATDTTKVTVLSLTLKGFYQPVDMNGVINVVKGGSTVPFKFEIFAGTTELTNIAYVTNVTPIPVACASNAPVDTIETTVTGGTSLRYDAASGQFIYNWKTPKVTNTCYRVTMTTIDGSSLVAYFKFK